MFDVSTEAVDAMCDIVTVEDALLQLITNSVNAHSTSITIRVSPKTIEVCDDGNGVSFDGLKLIGSVSCSSSSNRGRSLHSITRLSEQTIIKTRVLNENSTFTKTFTRISSKTHLEDLPESKIIIGDHQSKPGTSVTVKNLFYRVN